MSSETKIKKETDQKKILDPTDYTSLTFTDTTDSIRKPLMLAAISVILSEIDDDIDGPDIEETKIFF